LRPVKIAVTVPRQRSSFFIDYLQRIRDFGGEPVEITPERVNDRSLRDHAAGLLLPGGGDVDPVRYGAQRHSATDGVRPELDELEIELIRRARAADLPILAICRGHQLLNVAFGGTLQQHIESDEHRAHDGDGQASRWHEVRVEGTGRLSQLLGPGTHRVNSRHHQAVLPDTIASGLRATAMSPDGLVEAAESRDGSWIVSVQWHPERVEMGDHAVRLFEDFIETARARAGANSAVDRGMRMSPIL
jgi:putative glutamine amidotransferase